MKASKATHSTEMEEFPVPLYSGSPNLPGSGTPLVFPKTPKDVPLKDRAVLLMKVMDQAQKKLWTPDLNAGGFTTEFQRLPKRKWKVNGHNGQNKSWVS